jgi:hypothetical protein
MSELRADTITASDGTSPVTLTKQSASKQWLKFDGTGTIAIDDSFNTSSISDLSTGSYAVTMTNAISNVDYSNHVSVGESGAFGGNWFTSPMLNIYGPSSLYQAPTSTAFRFACVKNDASAYADPSAVTTSVDGDLA